jgi:hypothetical protein
MTAGANLNEHVILGFSAGDCGVSESRIRRHVPQRWVVIVGQVSRKGRIKHSSSLYAAVFTWMYNFAGGSEK